MLTTAALFAFLSQTPGGAASHSRPTAIECLTCFENGVSAAVARPQAARSEEPDFIRRYNQLATAIADFSHTYNSQGVIDVKKVKAIRKALRELEKSDWFNPKHDLGAR